MNQAKRGLIAFAAATVLLLLVAAHIPRASAQRPSLPATFVPINVTAFPTLQGNCNRATQKITVGPNGTYKSLYAAVAAARPRTMIVVSAGNYTSTDDEYSEASVAVNVDKDDLCIVGAGMTKSLLVAAPGQKYGMFVSGSNATIIGLSLAGFETAMVLGPAVENTTQRNVVLRAVRITGPPARVTPYPEGIMVYMDNSASGIPVIDGLLLSNVQVLNVAFGISCNSGPCHHWWMDHVTISCRPTGSENSGTDAFAIEQGKQVVITNSYMSGATADGIDVKGTEVLVARTTVKNVQRNGIKLWRGGDVQDCIVNGTAADAALVGGYGGTYRYLSVTVTRQWWMDRTASAYVGTWSYDAQELVTASFINCTFKDNAQEGGLWFPGTPRPKLTFINNTFYDLYPQKAVLVGDETYYGLAADLTRFEVDFPGSYGNGLGSA